MPAPWTETLLHWYDKSAAQLPWRSSSPTPYCVWVSEIMLQQTQVDTVIPYYTRFLKTYPTLSALASAPLESVLKQWEGLGYYSRARSLHRAAQKVVSQMDGQIPATAAALQELPGIGRYTAGAIASIAFGERVPVLDGNVIRVFSRLLDLPDDVRQPATLQKLWNYAEDFMPESRPGDYNQALMELGRMVCKPRQPRCDACPLREYCHACANGTQTQRPVKAKKAPLPYYDVAAGIIYNDAGQILIAQRPNDGLLGGLWEFPGGKQESGETLPQTLQRELREELAIEVVVGELFVRVRHAFTHFKIMLHAYECRHTGGQPQKIGVQDFAWVSQEAFGEYTFGKADRMVIDALQTRTRRLL